MKTVRKLAAITLAALAVMPATALLAQPWGGRGPCGGGAYGDGPCCGGPHGGGPYGGGGSFGEGPGFGPFFGRMAEELDLSDGQKAEIEALHEKHLSEIEPLAEKARTARQEVGDLMRGDAYDEQAVRAAAEQAADLHVELTVLRARHHSEVRAVLTPEQLEKAAELRQEWQEDGGRFRGRPGWGRGRGPGRGAWGGPGRGPARW